ncbi:MAG: S9 family peptidase, partial [Caulobacterales bacterium]|nr:S9 family peptidase [Caulobacterales bacterium]
KAIMDSKERIPTASRRGEHFYNFWQDAEHPRGLWRRTSLAGYAQAQPEWDVVLDLDALAGPPRPNPNRGRPAPGQQGRGTAPQATGPQVTAIFNQVYSHWNVFIACNMPGGDQLRIQVDVSLSANGRITAGPTLVNPRSDPVYRAAAEEAVRALRATAPFDVPDGFQGGAFRPTFNTERACRDR